MLDTYDEHSPLNPKNIDDIEVELSELEQLQEDYAELLEWKKKVRQKIKECVTIMEQPAEDNQNRLVINKLNNI